MERSAVPVESQDPDGDCAGKVASRRSPNALDSDERAQVLGVIGVLRLTASSRTARRCCFAQDDSVKKDGVRNKYSVWLNADC